MSDEHYSEMNAKIDLLDYQTTARIGALDSKMTSSNPGIDEIWLKIEDICKRLSALEEEDVLSSLNKIDSILEGET